MMGLGAIAPMSNIWNFLNKYMWLFVIVWISGWSFSQAFTDPDENSRIQRDLNNQAEEWFQRNQPDKQKDGDQLIHMY